ncbi:MAG: cell division protein FtsA [Methanobacteriota archaeon]|nr:MAG: cell division protein FtsA [Euryarchaeota archaeon]
MREDIIVGLDIGTTKVACVIAEAADDGIHIIGVGQAPSYGMKRGIITNIDKTTSAIRNAVTEAEKLAGVEVQDVYVSIKGDHIKSINSQGLVAISRSGREIEEEDVDRAIEAATAFALPEDRKILHVIPKEFKVDNLGEIQEPVGMTGVRLEVDVHVITTALSAMENLEKSVLRAGYGVSDIVLGPLATSYSVLKDDEMNLGVVLIDVGGGTSDIAMFWEDKIRYTSIIPVGGQHITNDLAYGLRTPPEKAESLKIKYGSAIHSIIRPDETIEIPGVGGRPSKPISRTHLVDIIRPRVIEILEMIEEDLKKSDLVELMQVGAVLTGGTALLPGFAELAEEILQMPVKIGFPSRIKGGLTEAVNSPVYSEAVGLILYALQNEGIGSGYRGTHSEESMIDKIINWLKDLF